MGRAPDRRPPSYRPPGGPPRRDGPGFDDRRPRPPSRGAARHHRDPGPVRTSTTVAPGRRALAPPATAASRTRTRPSGRPSDPAPVRIASPGSGRRRRPIPTCSAPTRSSSPAAARSRRRSSRSGPAIRLLVVPQRRQALERLVLHATSLRIPIVEVEGGTLTALAGFDGHQGIALVVGPAPLGRASTRSSPAASSVREPPFVLVLDSLEDPQNVGTLLRSAEAAGVHGVIFPTHHQAPLTPSAVKASAGAVEHLLLAPGRRPARRPERPPHPRRPDRRRRGRRAADRPPGRPPRTARDRRRQRGPGPLAGGPAPLRPRRPDPDARRRRLAQRRRRRARSCCSRPSPSATRPEPATDRPMHRAGRSSTPRMRLPRRRRSRAAGTRPSPTRPRAPGRPTARRPSTTPTSCRAARGT